MVDKKFSADLEKWIANSLQGIFNSPTGARLTEEDISEDVEKFLENLRTAGPLPPDYRQWYQTAAWLSVSEWALDMQTKVDAGIILGWAAKVVVLDWINAKLVDEDKKVWDVPVFNVEWNQNIPGPHVLGFHGQITHEERVNEKPTYFGFDVLADTYITPLRPVETITLTAILSKDGKNVIADDEDGSK